MEKHIKTTPCTALSEMQTLRIKCHFQLLRNVKRVTQRRGKRRRENQQDDTSLPWWYKQITGHLPVHIGVGNVGIVFYYLFQFVRKCQLQPYFMAIYTISAFAAAYILP